MTKRKAPWPDYTGQPIYEGDTIKHPDGTEGRVVRVRRTTGAYAWRVYYPEDNTVSRLQLQVGHRGRAIVTHRREWPVTIGLWFLRLAGVGAVVWLVYHSIIAGILAYVE